MIEKFATKYFSENYLNFMIILWDIDYLMSHFMIITAKLNPYAFMLYGWGCSSNCFKILLLLLICIHAPKKRFVNVKSTTNIFNERNLLY